MTGLIIVGVLGWAWYRRVYRGVTTFSRPPRRITPGSQPVGKAAVGPVKIPIRKGPPVIEFKPLPVVGVPQPYLGPVEKPPPPLSGFQSPDPVIPPKPTDITCPVGTSMQWDWNTHQWSCRPQIPRGGLAFENPNQKYPDAHRLIVYTGRVVVNEL
ncbi:hypothetical protein LCGC14_1111820 [marine sediment metagenome]|uniref:Uncharacterized protein n=1 Tax=marine sediment metagenome TaxID=412755 RepID=A0A0F9PPM6_9ZZZZ